MSPRRAIAAHPLAAFLVIGIGVYFVCAAIPALRVEVTAFELPLDGIVGGILGVGAAAFLVTAAADGRVGVVDLVARTLRWRVPARFYLLALLGVPLGTLVISLAIWQTEALETPEGGWLHVVGAVIALFVLQALLFQLAEEVGWTGFFQDRLRDRYGPIKLSAVVAVFWAIWHVPDYFAREGWSLETLASAVVFLVVEFVLLFFARVVIVWFYEQTARSVLIVILFHASFDATISRLSDELIPASNAVRFLIVTAVITLPAIALIVAWRREPAPGRAAVSV